MPEEGSRLYLNESGKISLNVIYDGVCYRKTFDNEDITINNCSDIDEPITLEAIITAQKEKSGDVVESGSWSNEDLTITLSGTAGASEIDSIKYCIDTENERTPDIPYTSAFTHSTPGTRFIRYMITNEVEVKSYEAKIDQVAPVVESSGVLTIYLNEVIDKNYDLCKGIIITDASTINCTNSMVTDISNIKEGLETYTINYSVVDLAGNITPLSRIVEVIPISTTLDFIGEPQTYNVASTGNYEIELYGAQGATNNTSKIAGGKGGYVKGTIKLNAGDQLFVYVGASGANGGYNGGGAGYYGGAGGSFVSRYQANGTYYCSGYSAVGGGSSYASSSFTNVSHTQGAREGDGQAIIKFIGN